MIPERGRSSLTCNLATVVSSRNHCQKQEIIDDCSQKTAHCKLLGQSSDTVLRHELTQVHKRLAGQEAVGKEMKKTLQSTFHTLPGSKNHSIYQFTFPSVGIIYWARQVALPPSAGQVGASMLAPPSWIYWPAMSPTVWQVLLGKDGWVRCYWVRYANITMLLQYIAFKHNAIFAHLLVNYRARVSSNVTYFSVAWDTLGCGCSQLQLVDCRKEWNILNKPLHDRHTEHTSVERSCVESIKVTLHVMQE